MSSPVIELAIRSPKATVSEPAFIAAKNAAVEALLQIPGVGPEREFAPFQAPPLQPAKVFVGMTRYQSQSRVWRSMLSIRFMRRLMAFMGMMDAKAGIFMQPDSPTFHYETFADRNNITEIALLRPKPGVSLEQFLKARAAFLRRLDTEPEVVGSYTFRVTGGFKNKDTFPHITVYKDQRSFDVLMERIRNQMYVKEFFQVFDAEIIVFCRTVK